MDVSFLWGVFHSRDVPFPMDVGSLLDVSFLWGVFHSRDVPFLLDVSFLWGVFHSRENGTHLRERVHL
jgi:ABC-type nickel/cobalt efflux system permease component RcnA